MSFFLNTVKVYKGFSGWFLLNGETTMSKMDEVQLS